MAKGVVLGRRVRITGPSHLDPCEVGPYTIFGGRVVVRSINHHTEYLNLQEIAQRRAIRARSVMKVPERLVRIGAGCWLGDNVTVLEGVEIGDGAIIGAGAVVTRSVPPYAIAVGNPARVVRYRFPEEVIELLAPLEWWTWSDEKLRANADLFETDLEHVEPDALRARLAQLR